jgi:hypothetical protein
MISYALVKAMHIIKPRALLIFAASVASLCLPLSPADLSGGSPKELLAIYNQLRAIGLDSQAVAVAENVELRKDAATLTFMTGYLYFLQPAGGEVAGAVFLGKGVLSLKPTADLERRQLARFCNGKTELEEPFDEAVLFFTDDTLSRLKPSLKLLPGSVPSRAGDLLNDTRKKYREKLFNNVEARLMAGLTQKDSAYFLADIKGRQHGQLLLESDSQVAEPLRLIHYRPQEYFDVWVSLGPGGVPGTAKEVGDLTNVDLDVVIDRSARISGKAKTEFTVLLGGTRWVPIRLARTLRVKRIRDASGQDLAFVQEDEKKDAELWVIAPHVLVQGEKQTWEFEYEGKDVIENAGSGNFFVGERTRWYPSLESADRRPGDRALYKMKFRVPKDFTVVATGTLLKSSVEGQERVSEWEAASPITVAGFNYGNYQTKSLKYQQFEVNVYTNPGLQGSLENLRMIANLRPALAMRLGITPGGLDTTLMAQSAAAEAAASLALYSVYFGDAPYRTLSVTQQPAANFGQSWPTLVFLPFTAFLDQTMQQQLGFLRGSGLQFFQEVGPHEVAHQWWGHTVGFGTYHDLWLSEGFAQFSAGLYVHRVKGEKAFREFIEAERSAIFGRLPYGQRANDVGPIWLGDRLNAENTPTGYRLVYTKGGYVLHTLRMLLRDFARGDDSRFMAMMHDYVDTWRGKNASTADFEAIVDKHFGRDMSWFFRRYVYGTEVPDVEIRYSVTGAGTDQALNIEIAQKGVSPDSITWMPVVVTTEKATTFGNLVVTGATAQGKIPLPAPLKSVEFNPLNAVLCDLKVTKL